MRLIDADSIVYYKHLECRGHGDFREEETVTREEIDSMPTVDVGMRHDWNIPEDPFPRATKRSAAFQHVTDFERCDDPEQLRQVMKEINRNRYHLVSVTQDSNDIYTVFFRRCVIG